MKYSVVSIDLNLFILQMFFINSLSTWDPLPFPGNTKFCDFLQFEPSSFYVLVLFIFFSWADFVLYFDGPGVVIF